MVWHEWAALVLIAGLFGWVAVAEFWGMFVLVGLDAR